MDGENKRPATLWTIGARTAAKSAMKRRTDVGKYGTVLYEYIVVT